MYRSSRIFIVILTGIIFVGEIILWNRVYQTITGSLDLRWPDLTAIFLVICWAILLGFFAFCIRKYGKNWWFRHKFARNKRYGPYLVFTESPDTSIVICFYNTELNVRGSDVGSLAPKLYLSADGENEESTHIIEYLPFSSFEIKIEGLFRFKISKLRPDTQYFYRIPSSFQLFSFKTAPSNIDTAPYNKREIRFLIAGDLHGGSGDNSNMYDFISKIIQSEKIDFILNTGDLLSDSSILSHYKTFFAQARDIVANIPILHTTGNHDGYRKKGARIWRTHFPQSFPNPSDGAYFSLRFGSIAIICIDFYNSGKLYEGISQTQSKWIEQALNQFAENNAVDEVFFSIHHPIASTGDCGINQKLLDYFTDLFDIYPKIKGVFSGHTHFFQLFEYKTTKRLDPICLLITGGAGKDLERSCLKKWYPRPYWWLKDEISNPKDFVAKNYSRGLQNDEFIGKYHRFTKIAHHISIISIDQRKLIIEARGNQGKTLFKSAL